MARRNLILSIAAGAVLALAMPKPGIWLASWVGLVPFFAVLGRQAISRNTLNVLPAAVLGLVTGAVYFGVVLSWISLFGYLPWLLLVVFQAGFFALFAVVASCLAPARIGFAGYVLVPAAWTTVQWLRSLGGYGFPWAGFAHTQANNVAVIQIACVTGPWGIEFLVCLANLALAQLATPIRNTSRFIPASVIGVLIAAVITIGHAHSNCSVRSDRKLKVAIVQGSLVHAVNPEPVFTMRAFSLYRKMSIRAAEKKPNLIVWPETTLPVTIDDATWGRVLSALAVETHASYLIGGYDAANDPQEIRSYNSAHLFDQSGRKLGVYHKVHLVPFGEFVPLRNQLPFLKKYGIRAVDVLPGDSHIVLRLGRDKIGVAICFESLFPQISRMEVRNGAGLLFVLTNDSWFQRTQAAKHHLMMARLRAVETRRYIVRAASSGISAIIDPYGRVTSCLGLFHRGVLVRDVAFIRSVTPYVRYGDWLAYLCALATAVGMLWGRCAFARL